MTVTAGELVGDEGRDSAGMPRPFFRALKDSRTGRWFRGVGDAELAEVDAVAPPLEEFEAFVAAGPYKAAFEALKGLPVQQATSSQPAADAAQFHAAGRKLSAEKISIITKYT